MTQAVLALDQGTTSSRAIIFDQAGRPLSTQNIEFEQHYPRPGWVEHDPEAIWLSQVSAARAALSQIDKATTPIVALGIANQRETTLLWDRSTGIPVYNAIVWQDRRTATLCDVLKASGWEQDIRARTGLLLDPYFSGTKLAWLLDNISGLRERAEQGDLAFGTVDSFLISRLTGGEIHATDTSNASRTMLFNIHSLDWDDDILKELKIPRCILPTVHASSQIFGYTRKDLFGVELPIAGVAGDQHAATFGQVCFSPGMAKQTYGTGSFLLMNTGTAPIHSATGLLTTIAWTVNGTTTYALEGSSFIAGAGVQWLRDELGIISHASETDDLSRSITSTGDVFFVPAFAGLGAPYWDARARGALIGLTRGTGRAEISRAVLESVAYQTRQVLEAMEADSGVLLSELRVDGGMVANEFLMQFQADILGRPVIRPAVTETTALGAAHLAGLATGVWPGQDEIKRNWQMDAIFAPELDDAQRDALFGRWKQAVERSRSWAMPEQE